MTTAGTKAARKLTRRQKFLLGGTLVGLLLCLIARTQPVIDFAWGQTRGTSWEPTVVRWALSIHGKPVEKALARGDIREGQAVQDVVRRHGPFYERPLGNYTILDPPDMRSMDFGGWRLIAKDGRARFAGYWSCTGGLDFFNTLTPAEETEVAVLIKQDNVRIGQARISGHLAVVGSWAAPNPFLIGPFDPLREPRMAVAGIGAYTEPKDPPTSRDE